MIHLQANVHSTSASVKTLSFYAPAIKCSVHYLPNSWTQLKLNVSIRKRNAQFKLKFWCWFADFCQYYRSLTKNSFLVSVHYLPNSCTLSTGICHIDNLEISRPNLKMVLVRWFWTKLSLLKVGKKWIFMFPHPFVEMYVVIISATNMQNAICKVDTE
jgi:hypothetical protein